MSSLIEVRNKIQSTKNTQKITKAMQLVAANKMKAFQKKAISTRTYALRILESLHVVHSNFKDTQYGKERASGKTVFILITSDKGLCGALNTRLINELFKSSEWNDTPEKERELITIGRKSHQAAKRFSIEAVHTFKDLPDNIDVVQSMEIIDAIMELWEGGDIKKILLISPHYVNPFTMHTVMKQYLPLNEELIHQHFNYISSFKTAGDTNIPMLPKDGETDTPEIFIADELLEPSEERVIEVLQKQVIYALFSQGFYELKASEFSSRMVAMKKATEAADEMIDDLTLAYNKARQAKITQELAELSAGSAAVT
jgi:F-type H+-transporting ATPase subunit gamma